MVGGRQEGAERRLVGSSEVQPWVHEPRVEQDGVSPAGAKISGKASDKRSFGHGARCDGAAQ
jgi:hypothetical protein